VTHENSRPRLTRVTPRSDVGTLWFDIEDSRAGLQMRNLVGRSFMYGHHRLTISPALKHVGVPQCTRCWRFGHPANPRVCPIKGKLCPICGEGHTEEYHRSFASCCRGKPKHTPPIPATPEGQPCSHDAKCINCGLKHRADDRACKYWKSRFDGDWIWRRYQEQKVSDAFTKFFVSRSNSPPLAGRGTSRIQSRSS
jgi:hypothetical protein